MKICPRTIDKPLLIIGLELEDVALLVFGCGVPALLFNPILPLIIFFDDQIYGFNYRVMQFFEAIRFVGINYAGDHVAAKTGLFIVTGFGAKDGF